MSKKFKSVEKIISDVSASVIIEQPKKHTVTLEITGITPYIQNCFSQKAIEQLLRKHMGLSVQREKKNPRQCIEDAKIYNTNNDIVIPSTAFKKAILSASRQVEKLTKTGLRTDIFISGGSIPVKYSRITPRMDIVRTSGIGRVPDIRFRPQYEDWSARLMIEFSDKLAVQTIVNLLNLAGSVGVGEWRPEKDGIHGRFWVSRNVEKIEEMEEVRDICRYPIKPIIIPDWAMDTDIDPELLKKIAMGENEENERLIKTSVVPEERMDMDVEL